MFKMFWWNKSIEIENEKTKKNTFYVILGVKVRDELLLIRVVQPIGFSAHYKMSGG